MPLARLLRHPGAPPRVRLEPDRPTRAARVELAAPVAFARRLAVAALASFAAGVALALIAVLAGMALAGPARATPDVDAVPGTTPFATVDLGTREGTRQVAGTWRFHDARIEEVAFRSPGPDRKPSGPPNRTYDVTPHAGAAGFDDSGWEAIDPTTLAARRSTGRVCFAWYRLSLTVPGRVGGVDPTGATLVFEVTVDDYAEVWVDGVLPRRLGQRGGSMVAGWNAPNRVVIGRDVRPGQRVSIAVFAMNGPLSDAPENFIWVRSASLEFHRPLAAAPAVAVEARVDRRDPGLDRIVPRDLVVEKLADGFAFGEGPVWVPGEGLLFSDPNTNVIYRYGRDGVTGVYRRHSGYQGADVARLGQPGSNGLTLDREGRLTIAEHGNRRISRLEHDGRLTVLADRFDGRRLNSPNDLVYGPDGGLWFTDPPFGLPRFHDDPDREQAAFGVYRLGADGRLTLASAELRGPNGIGFSPDGRYLYVANWDEAKKIVMRWEVRSGGTLANGRTFFDMTGAPGEEALDGLKVDRRGNLYVSGPGGVWILSPQGRHLGTLVLPELPANFAWGDDDGRTLYMTARTGLYRARLLVPGTRPEPVALGGR
jgi:gluconolactonase